MGLPEGIWWGTEETPCRKAFYLWPHLVFPIDSVFKDLYAETTPSGLGVGELRMSACQLSTLGTQTAKKTGI